jgi:selenocysteine lyase/cysteine desulfurase
MRTLEDLAALRAREFARLDNSGIAYLDYTGTALYPASLVRRDHGRLTTQVMGNPHSESAPSLASTREIERARQLTLRFLDADPVDYDVIFTANASGAIRILAESFPFDSGSKLVLTADNHNSVNGLRVPACRRGASVEYLPLDGELRLSRSPESLPAARAPSLFAFPAQSNFSGVHHPLEGVAQAQRAGYHVLLDAAAYVPSSPLSLRRVPADFVALSFYKMFGYPTGVGALLVRREALQLLQRSYFAGGTVQFVSVQNGMARAKRGPEAFEDGTPSFLALPAVCDGLHWLGRLGMRHVARHVRAMTQELLDRLLSLGERILIHGPRNSHARGGTIAFNVLRNGRVLPYERIEVAARQAGIAIRGGCFCNPGASEYAFAIPAERAAACLTGEFSVPAYRACLGDIPIGAVRASVGLPTNTNDLDRLLDLLVRLTD